MAEKFSKSLMRSFNFDGYAGGRIKNVAAQLQFAREIEDKGPKSNALHDPLDLYSFSENGGL